jgi:hypothetical protein
VLGRTHLASHTIVGSSNSSGSKHEPLQLLRQGRLRLARQQVQPLLLLLLLQSLPLQQIPSGGAMGGNYCRRQHIAVQGSARVRCCQDVATMLAIYYYIITQDYTTDKAIGPGEL